MEGIVMNRKRILVAVFSAVLATVLVSCNEKENKPDCPDCKPGTGAAVLALPVTSEDVLRVKATISGDGIPTPITQDLTIDGDPRTATGTIYNIPAGTGRAVLLEGYPALSGGTEADVVIYQGQETTDISAGQMSTVSITLNPVNGDVAITANFPHSDIDIARVSYVEATTTGNRINDGIIYYLTVDSENENATGTAQMIPVGAARTFTIKSYDELNNLLHEGTATGAVVESGSTETITLANMTGEGAASVIGDFCDPSCEGKNCGDDGCGGSCGGCRSNQTCVSGVCSGENYAIAFNGSDVLRQRVEAVAPTGFCGAAKATMEVWVKVLGYTQYGELMGLSENPLGCGTFGGGIAGDVAYGSNRNHWVMDITDTSCVIKAHMLIPIQSAHRFRFKLTTDSDSN